MPVIAMTREMGTGGRLVAQGVADALGLTVVLHELVEHDVADHLHAQNGTVHRLLEGGATLRDRLEVGVKRLARYTTEEILDLANRGNVLIRGWGACAILHDVPHIARIRVCASMETRVRRVMERSGRTEAEARREVERNDEAHKRILKAAHGVNREDAQLYDLVLNTDRVSIGTCVEFVCDLARSADFRETDASRAILRDKTLEAHIRIKLRERFTVGMGVSGADVRADGGRIILTGTAVHPTLVEDAAKLAGGIPGVKAVENRMVVVHGPRPLG